MTGKDPKTDTNYLGIGTFDYIDVIDKIRDSKNTFYRTTMWWMLDMAMLFIAGFVLHPNWDSYQWMVYGIGIGLLCMTYAFAILAHRDCVKKCRLRLGELE